jgi:hypothetical protein
VNIRSLFSQLFGAASEHLPIDDPEVAQMVRVMSRLQMHMQGPWRNAQMMGIRCEQQARGARGETLRCVEAMSGTCVACRRPVCLHHAAIVPDSGDLICFGCIGNAQQSARARANSGAASEGPAYSSGSPPPREEPGEDHDKLKRKFLRRLKLTGDPTEDEIRAAFRREAAKAHPDRAPADKRQKAHEKFVALGEARDWLLKHVGKRAA